MTYDPTALFAAYDAIQRHDRDPFMTDAEWDALWDVYTALARQAPRCEVCGDTPIWCPMYKREVTL